MNEKTVADCAVLPLKRFLNRKDSCLYLDLGVTPDDQGQFDIGGLT